MKRACPTVVPCTGEDSPILNLSSEAPDPLIFTGIGYTPAVTYRPPVLGDVPGMAVAQDCYGTAFSVDSQEIADLLAQINAIACQDQARGAGGSPVDPTPIPGGTPGTTPGRPTGKGGGGGGGGGGAENQRPTEGGGGGTIRQLRPNNAWSCLNAEADPWSTLYTLEGARPGVNYQFSVTSGSLPPGITLQQVGLSSAHLVGTGTTAGFYSFTIQAAPQGTSIISAQTADTYAVFGITNPNLPEAAIGVGYSYQLETDGGTAPVTFSAGAGFPTWATMSSSGLISGTPDDEACGREYSFPVTITDAEGGECTENLTLNVAGLQILGDPPPGTVCNVYGPFQFTTVPNGAVFSGSVPAGLTLDPDGTVHGTLCEQNGRFNIHAEMFDNPDCSGDRDFRINSTPPVGCPNHPNDLAWTLVPVAPWGAGIFNGSGGSVSASCTGFWDISGGGCGAPTASQQKVVATAQMQNCCANRTVRVTLTSVRSDVTCTNTTLIPPITIHTNGTVSIQIASAHTITHNFLSAGGPDTFSDFYDWVQPPGMVCTVPPNNISFQCNCTGSGTIQATLTFQVL